METGKCKSPKISWKGVIEEYREFLPVSDRTPIITLNEGNTPLIKALNLRENLGLDLELYFKFDGANPTGSFKDRGMTLALSKAIESGAKAVICASTGNTSAAAAAYAAKANIMAIVLIPEGKIALGKLAQALVHGAHVLQINGNFDEALSLVKALVEKYPITRVNSIPIMLGFQAAGAAPIVLGRPVEKPDTVATAIRIGNPASWKGAVAARDESGGRIDAVTDEEILNAYKLIASTEGIFCEPASAASLAGVIKLYKENYIRPRATVVCTLTGSGLKDPDTVFKVSREPLKIKADIKAVEKAIKGII
jgi:threonine synthase